MRVAPRMREHRDTTRAVYPIDGLRQLRPLVRHKAGLALHQIVLKHMAYADGLFIRDHDAGKVRTREQIHTPVGLGQSTLQRIFHADFFQLLRNYHGTLGAP